MAHYLLTASGPDKPGIVAAVTGALYGLGANLEDSAMARLQGEFAMILIFSSQQKNFGAALARAGRALKKKFGLAVTAKLLSEKELRPRGGPSNPTLFSIHGADKPGIVYKVTQILAKHKVNITDLATHRTQAPGSPGGYILLIEGDGPAAGSAELKVSLQKIARELGVSVTVKAVEPTAL